MVKKTIKLSSSPTSITVLEEYLQDLLLENQLCASKFPDILISLTEAVNNAIIHGNKSDASKEVQVNCKHSKTGISFSIIDQGNGFDPQTIPDPTSPEKIECCGGRGVFIINALADKVAYKNNGSTVEIYFNLA
ncbi:MAG: ATP-binding protein [Saprospiraceae bacterium]|nr:ATP-binding protein [Saprospiraceae bacterium]MBK7220235.1 ATP-binding protein [Saprospiraceae bacterium]MBK7787438.1 ATP-binding protein [Saprospiraceae bacterium]MBK8109751.1 ATP-binding protein [Saprospiraceae bacterium]MBK8849259.1 ATP-binding protein [Saprospiraceae bacterium]